MATGHRPDAIDSRVALRTYGRIAVTLGVFVYAWPNTLPERIVERLQVAGVPSYGRFSLTQIVAAAIAFAGCCAAGASHIEDAVDRRRVLFWFAGAHLLFGVMFWIQWFAIYDSFMPPLAGWAPLLVGAALAYVAVTGPTAPPIRRIVARAADEDGAPARTMRVDVRAGALDDLRSRYEAHIGQAVRQEERTRLARELHDAVKQQLFVIQTAAATVDARFNSDVEGAKTALAHVRAAARDAMSEMEALIGQLQASPVENAGLVSALKQQCEALRLGTGADVAVTIGALPASELLPPGAQHAIFRGAQEALANIARHARATHVKVSLTSTDRQLELRIIDDGCGFDPMSGRTGMGLDNMATRAGEAGGSFQLSSAPGRGTTVCFFVPLAAAPLRDYLTRLAVSAAILAATAVFLMDRGVMNDPWIVGVGTIAAIATLRYLVASVRVLRRRMH